MRDGIVAILVVFFISACTTLPSRGSRAPATQPVDITTLINRLEPFESDGCPAFGAEISYPRENKWELCCVQHDISYWKGGTAQDRRSADQRLQNCIIEIGEPNIARLLYWNVQAPHLGNGWRWGYGWTLPRGEAPFSDNEAQQVEQLEKRIPSDLAQVHLVSTNKKKSRRGLTKNACTDSALSFVQNHLSRKFTPLSAHESVAEVSAGVFEYRFTVMSKECHKPYTFVFQMGSATGCERRNAEGRLARDVELKDVDYPFECQ